MIRDQVLKFAPREVIEQVIFDPVHGIVKREIHFGIIDYLTVRSLLLLIKLITIELWTQEKIGQSVYEEWC